MKQETQYLIFNDHYPNGAIKPEGYVKTYPDFMTYVELSGKAEAEKWQQALQDMQPILELDLDSNSMN